MKVDDYQNRLKGKQLDRLIAHCTKYKIDPVICAWYDNMGDWYQDWVYDCKIFETKSDARERYKEGLETGELIKFRDGQIARLVV